MQRQAQGLTVLPPFVTKPVDGFEIYHHVLVVHPFLPAAIHLAQQNANAQRQTDAKDGTRSRSVEMHPPENTHRHTLRRHMSAEMSTRWLWMVSSCVVGDFAGRYFAFWLVAQAEREKLFS